MLGTVVLLEVHEEMPYCSGVHTSVVEKSKWSIIAQDNKNHTEGQAQTSGDINTGVLINV